MTRRSSLLMAIMALALGACGGPAPPHPGGAASTTSSAMEFSGERPCVDCDGIQAWLRLEQDGGARRYRMIEHYRSGSQERQFEDQGEWDSEGALLRLRSREGGERVYAHLADGRLQARDAHGDALPAAADDVMTPVTFDSMR